MTQHAPVSRLDTGLLTIKQLAAELGVPHAEVETQLESVQPALTRGTRALYRLADAWPALVSLAGGGNAREQLATARAALSRVRQRQKHLALRISNGEVQPVYVVIETFSEPVKSVMGLLATLPDVLERDCGLTPDRVTTLFQIIDAERAASYEQMVAGSATPP